MDKYTYGQSDYSRPVPNTWVIPANMKNNLVFDENDDYKPSLFLLESIVRAHKDREEGKASPIFNSVSAMKKWVDKQSE